MFMIIHILLGCLIGLKLNSLWLVIPLAFLSHFILDMIPHWDGEFNKKLFYHSGKVVMSNKNLLINMIDALLMIIAFIFILNAFDYTPLLMGAIFSVLPDVAKWLYATPLRKNKYFMEYLRFHAKIQKDIDFDRGIFVQIVIAVILLTALF